MDLIGDLCARTAVVMLLTASDHGTVSRKDYHNDTVDGNHVLAGKDPGELYVCPEENIKSGSNRLTPSSPN